VLESLLKISKPSLSPFPSFLLFWPDKPFSLQRFAAAPSLYSAAMFAQPPFSAHPTSPTTSRQKSGFALWFLCFVPRVASSAQSGPTAAHHRCTLSRSLAGGGHPSPNIVAEPDSRLESPGRLCLRALRSLSPHAKTTTTSTLFKVLPAGPRMP
jgi:hypothetical protein